MRGATVTLAMLIAALATSTAHAADQVETAPPATYDWSGLHIGIGAGLGGVSLDAGGEIYNYDEGAEFSIGPAGIRSIGAMLDLGGDGALGTVEAGFDLQLGERFVIGIQGDYTWSNLEAGGGLGAVVCYEADPAADSCDTGTPDDEINLDYTLVTRSSWSVLGRVGYVANPGALTYVLGGFTRTSLEGELILSSGLSGSTPIASYDYERDGVTFGGGIEAPITGAMTLKMEYRRTEWDNDDSTELSDFSGINTWDDAVVQSMRGVLSWRFGGDNAAQQAAVDAIPAVDWTGFNVGVAGGFSAVRHNGGLSVYDYDTGGLVQVGPVDIFEINGNLDLGGEGYLGRLEAGYDVQLGERIVLGGFGDYTFASAKSQVGLFGEYCLYDNNGTDDCFFGFTSGTADLTYTLETGDSWSVGGRAGMLINPQTLLYGLGAFTRQNMKADLTLNTGLDGVPAQELLAYDYDRDGWTFGIGMQTMLTDRLSTKLEYRNTSWDEEDVVLGNGFAGISRSEDSTVQLFTVGLSWRLN
jgi:outer membrane immunogenic protein